MIRRVWREVVWRVYWAAHDARSTLFVREVKRRMLGTNELYVHLRGDRLAEFVVVDADRWESLSEGQENWAHSHVEGGFQR